MRSKSNGYPFIVLGGTDHRVKLGFVTTGVTSCLLEAHDMREVEISNKHLLKTYSETPGGWEIKVYSKSSRSQGKFDFKIESELRELRMCSPGQRDTF